MLVALVVAQAVALTVLLVRLAPGFRRPQPVQPSPREIRDTSVSVIVPVLNEAERLSPCLTGLSRQGDPVTEILVVDSHSTDGTADVVLEAAARDSRIKLLNDPPLPEGWIGKVWALQYGLSHARGNWVLGMDGDTEAKAGLAAGAVTAARAQALDIVSFTPSFAPQPPGEAWLHPALLLTLVYRLGAPGSTRDPDRLLANGQCFLARRDVLTSQGGYEQARRSFADDVTLARHYARKGARVGFLDGSLLFRVAPYGSARKLWREWGRSLDLADATPRTQHFGDLALLVLVQALPLPLLLSLAFADQRIEGWIGAATAINALLLGARLLMLPAIAGAYERKGFTFWLSPLADPLAVLRVVLSTVRRRVEWRGREYRR